MSTPELVSLRHPPEVVVSFVRRLIDGNRADQPERRSDQREGITLPVFVRPLDENFQPTADGFSAVTHNISTGGIGLVHHEAIPRGYLQLELTARDGETMSLAAQVRHCTPCGEHYQIGARFMVDWSLWKNASRDRKSGDR